MLHPHLVRLSDLYNNQLSGAIPTSLGNLTSLRYMYGHGAPIWLAHGLLTFQDTYVSRELYNNQLSGTIPSSIGYLPALLDLYAGVHLLALLSLCRCTDHGHMPVTLRDSPAHCRRINSREPSLPRSAYSLPYESCTLYLLYLCSALRRCTRVLTLPRLQVLELEPALGQLPIHRIPHRSWLPVRISKLGRRASRRDEPNHSLT